CIVGGVIVRKGHRKLPTRLHEEPLFFLWLFLFYVGKSRPRVSGASGNRSTPSRNRMLNRDAASAGLNPCRFISHPLTIRIGAANNRPRLKHRPPPVPRRCVGNSSGK